MTIKARDIQSAVVDALAKSVAITAQSIAYFGVAHQVSGGGSGRQGQTAAPAFAVVAWSRTAGEDDTERAFEVSVLLSITDDTITVTTEDVDVGTIEEPDIVEVDVETYGGPDKLETLLELAAAEILAISSEIMISELNYSFEPLEYFPLFVGGLDFTVTFPVLIGGYEPTLT